MQDRGDLMKLNDLPAGSVQLPRTGRPLNGWELAEGLKNLTWKEAGNGAALELEKATYNEWWNREHLQFPRAQVEWRMDEKSGWVVLTLMANKWFQWEFGPVCKTEWTELVKRVGPCDRPDDLREALGLPVVVNFRQPDKAIVSVRVDGGMGEFKPEGVRYKTGMDQAMDAPSQPVIGLVEIVSEELVAEPPKVPLLATKPVVVPAATKLQGVVLKGGRK